MALVVIQEQEQQVKSGCTAAGVLLLWAECEADPVGQQLSSGEERQLKS